MQYRNLSMTNQSTKVFLEIFTKIFGLRLVYIFIMNINLQMRLIKSR